MCCLFCFIFGNRSPQRTQRNTGGKCVVSVGRTFRFATRLQYRWVLHEPIWVCTEKGGETPPYMHCNDNEERYVRHHKNRKKYTTTQHRMQLLIELYRNFSFCLCGFAGGCNGNHCYGKAYTSLYATGNQPLHPSIFSRPARNWACGGVRLGLRRLKTCSGRSQLLLATGHVHTVVHCQSPSGDGSYQKL